MDNKKIECMFKHHPPNAEQVGKYEKIREHAKRLAQLINAEAPECADKTHAIRCLRDAIMWANAAIATDGQA